jgi:hypothetical protein
MRELFSKWVQYSYKCIISLKFTIPIKVITKLPNSEQSYKGKVKTHNYINRQNQSTYVYVTHWQKNSWHFWLLYLYTFSLYENASFIIFLAETEYISTRYWYRNINFLKYYWKAYVHPNRHTSLFFFFLSNSPWDGCSLLKIWWKDYVVTELSWLSSSLINIQNIICTLWIPSKCDHIHFLAVILFTQIVLKFFVHW